METDTSQAEKITAALKERGLSIRAAAGLLADISGNTRESERRSIYRWLNGERMTDERAEQFARALRYPKGHFTRPPGEPSSLVSLNRRIAEVAMGVQALTHQMERVLDLLEQLADGPSHRAGATSHKGRDR